MSMQDQTHTSPTVPQASLASPKMAGDAASPKLSETTSSGLPFVGELVWGDHFCQFYETADDLRECLVPYFRAGLENNEKCLWVTSPPFGVDEAAAALREVVPDLDKLIRQGQIEIIAHSDWYVGQGGVSVNDIPKAWLARAHDALAAGYQGLRLTGNTAFLEASGWHDFMHYEAAVHRAFKGQRIVALCSYPIARCRFEQVLDVVRNHGVAIARRNGRWETVESAALADTKADLARLNRELESRIAAQTEELRAALAQRERAEQRALEQEQRFRDLLEALPAAVYTTDGAGRITYYNKAAATLAGREPTLGSDEWCVTWKLYWPDGLPLRHDECPMALALREQRPNRGMEAIAERPDGARVPFLPYPTPLFDNAGKLAGAVNMLVDITERKAVEEALRESEARVAGEAKALARLNELSSRLWQMQSLQDGLDEMLAATIDLLGADMGNIQVLDAKRGVLTIEAQRGFERKFLEFFGEVSADDDSACGRALRCGERIVIEDVDADAAYAPLRSAAHDAGYRAVQSTPLIGRHGKAVGMISTHWRSVHRPSEQDLRRLDLYARQAADFIERCKMEKVLRLNQTQLESELAAMRQLQEASAQLINERGPKELYDKIIDAAVSIMHSDFASMQMFHHDRGEKGELQLLAFRGFDPEATKFWEWVRADSGCTCGEALRTGRRAIAENVETCGFMAGTDDRTAYLQAGMYAAQSTPLYSRSGRLLGMISTHWRKPHSPTESELRRFDVLARQAADVIERTQAARELRESEEQLRLAIQAADVGLWDVDPVNDRLFWPARVKSMFGISADAPVSMADFYAALHPDDRERVSAAFADAIDPKKRALYDVEYRAIGKEDGAVRWIAAKGRGVFDNGTCVRVIGTALDITARKRGEEHRILLINELNHRVKNTLATVQSFASQTLRNAKSTAEARDVLDSRLVALAKAHDVLTREHWDGAGLSEVVADAIAPYSSKGGPSRFQVEGPNLRLHPKAALALSMALHELATNAVKYGALSNGTGVVEISWLISADDPRRFRLRWTESGGPPVEKRHRSGFGSRLVERGLAQDLNGEVRLNFERSGLICTIDAPLSEVASGGEQPSWTR